MSHYENWKQEEIAPFEGWDFSYAKGRIIYEEPPWNYRELAKELVSKSHSLLDIATGGGERLAALAPLPSHTVAGEGWHPNIAVAQKRLKPLGVAVVEFDEKGPFPFQDNEFDTVLDRHGGLNISEITRVLANRGQFLTQQVDGTSAEDLRKLFGTKAKWPENNLPEVVREAEVAGLKIKRAEEWSGKLTFKDVGALVYHLTNIPWTVEGFSVDTYRKQLEALQDKVDRGEQLIFIIKRFLLRCEK